MLGSFYQCHLVALISPDGKVSACGNKQASKTRALTVTAFLFLILLVSLGRGGEFQDFEIRGLPNLETY